MPTNKPFKLHRDTATYASELPCVVQARGLFDLEWSEVGRCKTLSMAKSMAKSLAKFSTYPPASWVDIQILGPDGHPLVEYTRETANSKWGIPTNPRDLE